MNSGRAPAPFLNLPPAIALRPLGGPRPPLWEQLFVEVQRKECFILDLMTGVRMGPVVERPQWGAATFDYTSCQRHIKTMTPR